MMKSWNKIQRKILKWRLQPIRVFDMHHVCETFDAEVMVDYDWMQIDEFKNRILAMQQKGVQFISLTDAYTHICNDKIRKKRYVVLTFDDGYKTLKEILPWLEEQEIPVALFINGKYLDGKSYRQHPKEKYLTKDELFNLISPLIEIGSHGWEHVDASKMSIEDFQRSVSNNEKVLQNHPRYVPYYAYTHGRHNLLEDKYLAEKRLIPILIDGADNYNDKRYIHRRLL